LKRKVLKKLKSLWRNWRKRRSVSIGKWTCSLEKERILILEKALAKEKVKVKKLAIDLSLANDSKERMSKETTLINKSLASLKATHSELQESFSCLKTKYKGLEVNYNALWESIKTNSKATLDSDVSTNERCTKCTSLCY
jgi:chromosome segregation ATPase